MICHLTFQIIEGAGLNENQRQIALTLANDLTFKNMKRAFKRVLSDKVEDENPIHSSFIDVLIKQENQIKCTQKTRHYMTLCNMWFQNALGKRLSAQANSSC